MTNDVRYLLVAVDKAIPPYHVRQGLMEILFVDQFNMADVTEYLADSRAAEVPFVQGLKSLLS